VEKVQICQSATTPKVQRSHQRGGGGAPPAELHGQHPMLPSGSTIIRCCACPLPPGDSIGEIYMVPPSPEKKVIAGIWLYGQIHNTCENEPCGNENWDSGKLTRCESQESGGWKVSWIDPSVVPQEMQANLPCPLNTSIARKRT